VWQVPVVNEARAHARLLSVLSADECTRYEQFRQPADQNRFLTGRGVLRILLGAHLQIAPELVLFRAGPFGKPGAIAPNALPALEFNVAHSGAWVLLALSRTQAVGVDIEEIRPNPEWPDIARQVFPPAENEALLRLPVAERLPGFYQAWTRHEAGLKALGLGLTDQRPNDWDRGLTLFDLEMPTGYRGAVACSSLPRA
jgi:4'-phosphopantetheinyl transferase